LRQFVDVVGEGLDVVFFQNQRCPIALRIEVDGIRIFINFDLLRELCDRVVFKFTKPPSRESLLTLASMRGLN
jgi:hypothetical protein